MNVAFAFDDWQRQGKSIYRTDEGIELSSADFHSGTVFRGTIDLGEWSERELRAALLSGATPVFRVFLPTPQEG